MTAFFVENLLLLPFLFATYLVLEAIEAKAGGAFGRYLGRVRSFGPVVGSLAGAVPQCGIAASAASLYSGGVITVGTLVAVFLSTSDELVPVLLSYRTVSVQTLFKIVGIKIAGAVAAGVTVDLLIGFFGKRGRSDTSRIDELCRHSRCGCCRRKGIVVPALIHTAEIFVFILAVSAAFRSLEFVFGTGWVKVLALDRPFIGELTGAALGLIPNCAPSVICAQMYAADMISPGALMAGSFTGCGVGLAVLFRQNRDWKANLAVLAAVYAIGCVLGLVAGGLL